MTAPIPGFGDEEYTKGLVAKRARTSDQPADVPRRSRRQQSEMDLFTDSSTTCLALCWANCDFRQMCSLFSWNRPFMNYFRGQWHQAWPRIPNTQGVRCGFTGLGSQRTQGQRSQVEDQVEAKWKLRSVIDHCPASFTLLCCKGETQALGLCRSPSQWKNCPEDILWIYL